MANKIISFGTSSNNFIDSSLSTSLSSNTPDKVYIDVSMESAPSIDSYDKHNHWKVDSSINVKAVFNSLRNIFTWTPGERILLPEFGSRLRSLLYEGITVYTEERIAAEIRQCVSEWEPRVSIIDIRDISTIEDTEDNTIHLQVVFTINGLSDLQYTYDYTFSRSD